MELSKLRKEIDKIDDSITRLLAKRLLVVKKIAKFKLKNNIEAYDSKREKEILQKKSELGKGLGLRKGYIEDIFKKIISESRGLEKDIIKKNKAKNNAI